MSAPDYFKIRIEIEGNGVSGGVPIAIKRSPARLPARRPGSLPCSGDAIMTTVISARAMLCPLPWLAATLRRWLTKAWPAAPATHNSAANFVPSLPSSAQLWAGNPSPGRGWCHSLPASGAVPSLRCPVRIPHDTHPMQMAPNRIRRIDCDAIARVPPPAL